MFRTLITTAILALTVTAAQAGISDQLAARIHDAAVVACAPQRAADTMPIAHYGAIYDHCVYRISRSAMARYQAEAEARAARAKLANN